MAINKVVDRNGSTLIDLTSDTVSPNKVLAGTKFHGADGKEYFGSLPANELDIFKYNFIDYDGTLMYSLTDAEIDAMTELPAGPNHTEDNLTFQGWNWTLEELKSWDKTRMCRPIVGACLITSDEKTYITVKTTSRQLQQNIIISRPNRDNHLSCNIDWGDGTVETIDSTGGTSYTWMQKHTYPEAGKEYVIIITSNTDNVCLGNAYDGSASWGSSDLNVTYGWNVKDIKIGKIRAIAAYSPLMYSSDIGKVNIPLTSSIHGPAVAYSRLKTLVIPEICKSTGNTYCSSITSGGIFTGCRALESLSFPKNMEVYSAAMGENTVSSLFNNCQNLKFVTLPEITSHQGVTLGCSGMFQWCSRLPSIDLSYNRDVLQLSSANYMFAYTGLKRVDLTGFENVPNYLLTESSCIERLEIPQGVTTIGDYAFQYTQILQYIKVPDSVTTIKQRAFNNAGEYGFTLDLLSQTKVINLTSDPYITKNAWTRILIPAALLDQYKSASYWANYANYMIGV